LQKKRSAPRRSISRPVRFSFSRQKP
jgi:hypothetical protein